MISHGNAVPSCFCRHLFVNLHSAKVYPNMNALRTNYDYKPESFWGLNFIYKTTDSSEATDSVFSQRITA